MASPISPLPLALRYFGVDDLDEIRRDGRYLASVYFAITTMTTVGYGDITPANNAERGFCFVAMIIGGAFYGYVIGNMVSIVNDSDVATKEYHTRMEQLFSYMNERHFPPDLHRRVKKLSLIHI